MQITKEQLKQALEVWINDVLYAESTPEEDEMTEQEKIEAMVDFMWNKLAVAVQEANSV